MVGKCRLNRLLVERVDQVYAWIASRLKENPGGAGTCRICGQCCDFDKFDHRLFITTPEIVYLAVTTHVAALGPMDGSTCPFCADGRCSIYPQRFAGCRIFCCTGDADFQAALSEEAVARFKGLCTELGLAYRYSDLAMVLGRPVIDICQWAAGPDPPDRGG